MCVKYKKLQDYCYACRRIDHDQKMCKGEKVVSFLNPKLPRYGPSVGVLVAKTLATIIKENEARKEKSWRSVEEDEAHRSSPGLGTWNNSHVQLNEYKVRAMLEKEG